MESRLNKHRSFDYSFKNFKKENRGRNKKNRSFFKTLKWQFIVLCLLILTIISFISIFLTQLKLDHYTYEFLFGSVAKYIFYVFSFYFLILEIFRWTAHPIINRKIISLIFLTVSITVFISLSQFINNSTASQAFSDFYKNWKNNQRSESGAVQTLYVALFLLIPIHWLSFTLALVIDIIFFLFVLSVLLTNHAYYLYYWCIAYLIYLRRKRAIFKQAVHKYQDELYKKQKEIYLKHNQKKQHILKPQSTQITESVPVKTYFPKKPLSYLKSDQRISDDFILNQDSVSNEGVLLQQSSKETEEIWKKAHSTSLINEPTKLNLDTNILVQDSLDKISKDKVLTTLGDETNKEESTVSDLDKENLDLFELPDKLKNYNKKLISDTKTIVGKTLIKEMPKPEKLTFFQSLQTNEVERKKIFSIPERIKQRQKQIRSTVMGDDISLTPFKRMTTEEVIINQEKNEKLNNEIFNIKDLSPLDNDNNLKNQKTGKQENKLEDLIAEYPNLGFFSYDLENYKFPRLDYLKVIKSQFPQVQKDEFVKAKEQIIISTFKAFNMDVLNIESHISSSVIQYRLRLPENVNLNRVIQIQNNLKLGLAAKSLRIQAPIPGFSLVGIETDSPWVELISLKTLLEEQMLINDKSFLTIPIGRNINGKCQILNIEKLPHLLIAGATGTGKSVCLNIILIALLLTHSPNELRIVLIDPKKVEMTAYQNLPHLLFPVIKTIDKAKSAFIRLLNIMDNRYHFLAQVGYKKIADYNRSCTDNKQKLSYIVVLIDELADLMLTSGKIFENYILRIAQLGRAAGIHLILSTQRPSVNIITGVIKANIVARISFQVGSAIDSKIVLDQGGAENLLGNGDMLFLSPSFSHPLRIQGPFITDGEINTITRFIINQQAPKFLEDKSESHSYSHQGGSEETFNDELYPEIKRWVENDLTQISSSYLQRKYRIGFNRAASIIDQLERDKIIGPQEGSKPRKVLK